MPFLLQLGMLARMLLHLDRMICPVTPLLALSIIRQRNTLWPTPVLCGRITLSKALKKNPQPASPLTPSGSDNRCLVTTLELVLAGIGVDLSPETHQLSPNNH